MNSIAIAGSQNATQVVVSARLPLHSAVYTATSRVTGWNIPINPLTCSCRRTAAQLLKRRLPDLSAAQHLEQSRHHLTRAERLDAIWSLVWERAFKDAHGRPPLFHDYRISAIGDDGIAEHHKRVLRHCAYTASKHSSLAYAHAYAGGHHRLSKAPSIAPGGA